MKRVLCLIALFALKLSAVEATINICIPWKSAGVEVISIYELFQNVTNDLAAKLSVEEDKPDLYVDHINVDITHPAIRLKGTLDDVSVYNLSKLKVCFLENIFANGSYYKFDVFNLTFADLRVEGIYNLTGDLGDIFDIYGDGSFWLEFGNFSVAMTDFRFNLGDEMCAPINVEIDIQENHFENFMYEKDLEQLFNEVITGILPDSLKIIWSEQKERFDKPLEDAMNDIIRNKSVSLATVMRSASTRSATYCFTNNN